MEIKNILTGYNWFEIDGVTARGYCFTERDELLKDKALAMHFATVTDEKTLAQRLTSQRGGLFAIIINKPNFKAVAVDNARIYPLFYNSKGVIADSAYSLLNAKSTIDNNALEMYHVAGMTPENKTLICDIHQVAPSSYVIFENDNIICKKYYNYLIEKGKCKKKDLKELNIAIEKAFEQAISSVEGRQIVVPLSGGYDSRLIICMLHKLKYKNVLCYTVGNNDSYEVKIARKVCQVLGYKHIIVDNTAITGSGLDIESEVFKAYSRHLGNLICFTYVFEFVALRHLKNLNVISDDAVFMPGHSGDFYGGAYVRKSHVTSSDSPQTIANKIIFDILEFGYSHKVKRLIANNISSKYEPHSVVQDYVLNNTLALNINNSARIYEHFQHEVRMPFWSKYLLDFFKDICPEQLTGDRLYYTYVHDIYKHLEIDFRQPEYSLKDIQRQWYKNRIRKLLPKRIASLFTKHNNITDELTLCQPMIKQIKGKPLYSVNDLMREWYLAKVKELLQ